MSIKQRFVNAVQDGWSSFKSNSTSTTVINREFMDLLRLGSHSHVSPAEAYNIYNFNSAVSDAVDSIASKTANLRPIIKKDDGSIINEHNVLAFLKNPNKLQNYPDFMESVSTNFLLNKNTYIEIIGNVRFKPSEMYSLKNTWVSTSEQPNAASYIVTVTGFFGFLSGNFLLTSNTGRILGASNLVELSHIKGFALSRESLIAVSVLSSIERDVEMMDQANNHNLSLLTKGFNGSGLVSIDTDDNEGYEQFKRDFRDKYQGSGNAGIPVVSKGKDIQFTSFGQTNKEMEYSKVRKMSQETAYQRFEFPKPLIDGSAQTFNNYQTARGALYDDAVFPLADKIFAGLTKVFKDRGMLKPDELITYDMGDIPALQQRQTEELKSLRAAFILSTNELRAIAGYEEVDGGDSILAPSNLFPIADDKFTSDNLDEPSKEFVDLDKKDSTKEPKVKSNINDLDEPHKEFVDLMTKNGANYSEVKEYWNEYKAAFRPNEAS